MEARFFALVRLRRSAAILLQADRNAGVSICAAVVSEALHAIVDRRTARCWRMVGITLRVLTASRWSSRGFARAASALAASAAKDSFTPSSVGAASVFTADFPVAADGCGGVFSSAWAATTAAREAAITIAVVRLLMASSRAWGEGRSSSLGTYRPGVAAS